VGTLWLNEHLLGWHEGAFSRQTIEITPFARADGEPHSYRVGARLWGANAWPQPEWRWWERLLIGPTRLAQPGKASIRPYHPRLRLLRPPMQAGWDFAPALAAIGLWEGVRLEVTGPVRVAAVRVGEWRFAAGDESASADVTLLLDVAEATRATLRLRCEPQNFEGEGGEAIVERELAQGSQRVTVPLTLTRPQPWHPWEQGAPNLYSLKTSVEVEGRLSSTLTTQFGIRTVTMEEMRLTVNGAPFFARGVNWVPADILPGTVPRERYRALLEMARERGVNLLRVWGGGGRERRDFYDLCDELGLLVWQEFPFACAFLDHYPRDAEFLRLAEQEAGAMVRELRHHPSLALWCAGNEFSYQRNRSLVDRLQALVRDHDCRPFLRPSPGAEDRHNWHVWHGQAPAREYAEETSAFLSEFGLQAPPARASLERFLPPDALWPPNELWAFHHADVAKLRHYIPGDALESLDAFIEGSQAAQAWGVQVAIERMRRRKADGAGGVAVWQWNEPWPAISWALVDYFGVPKAAAEGLRQWYHPLLLSLEWDLREALAPGDVLRAGLWAINDLRTPFEDCEARLWQGEEPLWWGPLHLPPHSARRVADLAVPLPYGMEQPLRVELWQGQTLLAENHYPLHAPDLREPPALLKLYRTLAELVMRW
ncbi:MAG TPA: glycoside hydrolase family 2 TIM barrel-domain containing protein, partial [Ardenticatenaceae bacterium]